MAAAGAFPSAADHGPAVNPAPSERPEPVDRWMPGTGSGLSDGWGPVVELVLRWAGPGLEALVLSGSHASGEAVWVEHEGRRVSLSDLDLFAVMRDEAAVTRAARARAATPASELAEVARAVGLVAPLEVAFLSRAGLARMPARPGTVELARAGRVLRGDAEILTRLRRWRPADISAEERLLLLENRAFELLSAWHVAGQGLQDLRARHAILKTALDLAASRTLAEGELPARAVERVARARALGAPADLPSWLAGAWDGLLPLWEQALAWRSGAGPLPESSPTGQAWRSVARGWCAAWWSQATGERASVTDPWSRALASASRGSLARRWRRAFSLEPGRSAEAGATTTSDTAAAADRGRRGQRDSLFARLRHAHAGTPLLRVHGTGVVLVLAAAQSAAEPVLPAGALRALRRLGVTDESRFGHASLEALAAWGRVIDSPVVESSAHQVTA